MNETGKAVKPAALRRALIEMLDSESQPPSKIAVLIADSQAIRDLNRRFRNVDEATDVLSFPAGQGPEVATRRMLGDIAICLSLAQQQAQTHGLSVDAELACLAVHGGLHLVGYEDDTEDKRREMLKRMNEAVRAAGIEGTEDWASLPH